MKSSSKEYLKSCYFHHMPSDTAIGSAGDRAVLEENNLA
jgi:hypothetical protein